MPIEIFQHHEMGRNFQLNNRCGWKEAVKSPQRKNRTEEQCWNIYDILASVLYFLGNKNCLLYNIGSYLMQSGCYFTKVVNKLPIVTSFCHSDSPESWSGKGCHSRDYKYTFTFPFSSFFKSNFFALSRPKRYILIHSSSTPPLHLCSFPLI